MTKKTKAPEATDAEILFPERELEIVGEVITVREFTFAESLKAAHLAQPICRDLAAPLLELDEDALSYNDVDAVFAEHAEAFIQLIAMATRKDAAWIAALPEADGQILAMTFWDVNQGFFTRRIAQQLIGATMRKKEETNSESLPAH